MHKIRFKYIMKVHRIHKAIIIHIYAKNAIKRVIKACEQGFQIKWLIHLGKK